MPRAPKSRFRSVAGKKIERQVRKDAKFYLYVKNRRGHGVVSGANHRCKPVMDSKNRHKSNILLKEKVASSAMTASKTNKRDNVANGANWRDNVASLLVGQAPTKGSNTRHMDSSTTNRSLDPLLRNPCKNNRRDDGVPYLASQLDRRNPTKDENIKHNNISAMHSSFATLSRSDNKRSVVVEANRQVNHASRPIKQDPPRKNTNTKRVDAIMPNGNLTTLARRSSKSRQLITPLSGQPTTSSLKKCLPSSKNVSRRDDSIVVLRSLEDHDLLKVKTTTNRSKHINNSRPPQLKAMAGLVHKTPNFNGCDGYNDALPSRLNRQVSLDNGVKHSDTNLTIKTKEEASSKRMKKQRNTEAKGDDTSDRNPMGGINGDAYPSGVIDYSERNLSYGLMRRQRGNTITNKDEAIDNGDLKLMEVGDGGAQLEETCDRRLDNKKKRGIESNEVGDGKADDSFAKKNLESLPKDHVLLDCSNEAIESEKLALRKSKKSRQDIIMGNEYEDLLHFDCGDHSPLDADGDSARLTSQAPISIDCLAKGSTPFALEHVKQKCNYCSKPIDKPIWSGIFKIDGEEYISLAGHLSTKSCDKVWELSRSLMPVVDVTKLSRSKFKIWETSKPSFDSIGLYFFPNKMRHDEDLDKLVKEVIEDDLVLQTVIDEAEMLIFPSTLLPERYKTFQRKHYLWGVFRPRQDQCATVAEPMHDTVCRAQEENETEEHHASNQQDEVQRVHCKSPAMSMQQAAAARGVPWSSNMDFQPEAPEERQLGDASRHTVHSAEATAVLTNPAAVTTEAAAVATDPAAVTTDAELGDALCHTLHGAEATAVAINPAAVTTEAAAAVTTEAAAPDTNAATTPAEANENDTNAATIPGNHGQSDSIVGVPPGRVFCFVAGQTPRLEQLIQEMQREGSLVLAIRGEAIGAGLWPGSIAPTNISRA